MSVVVWLAVLVAAAFWALPFVFMFFTSIKSQQDVFHGFAVPATCEPQLEQLSRMRCAVATS